MEMLSILLDDSPAGREIETPVDEPAANEPGDLELLARAAATLPRQPVRMIRALPATLRHIDQLPTMRTIPGAKYVSGAADWAARRATRNRDGRQLERTSVRAPRVSLGGRISAHRRFAYGSLPLATVKAVKNEVPGLTVNDVVVALCAGALRRRLAARGEVVDGPLVAMVPVTVRTGTDREYGNRISSMIVAIPTDVPDARERLERAHEVMKAAKDRHRAIPANLLQDANHTVPPALFARTARVLSMTTAAGWVDPPFNTTISNIPGSPNPLFCAGARVVSQHPVNVLIEGLGLSLTLLSYMDQLDFSLTADRELVPDVWDLKNDLEAELAELAHIVGATR